MEIGIGTAGLKKDFNEDYWKVFCQSIDRSYLIHTSLNYKNVDQYFVKAFQSKIKIKKIIVKIEINRNPIKKFLNIPKQIDQILNRFKIDNIDTIQICNNPGSSYLNAMIIKSILNSYKKKNIINNFYLESFEPFSENLSRFINDDYFNGFLFTLNCFQKGTSIKFFRDILSSNKKIIAISPLANGQYNEILNKFEPELEDKLKQIISKNNLNNFIQLQIAFLKYIANLQTAIFGTKKYKRFLDLENLIKNTNKLDDESFDEILNLQEKYKTIIKFS